MTTLEFLEKYDNKYVFSGEELHDLFWGDCFDDDENVNLIEEDDSGEHYRWSYCQDNYYKIRNRYFRFSGQMGLTEYQENYFDIQPCEVVPKEKVITVTVWEEK